MKKLKKTIAYLLALTCCFSGTSALSGNYNNKISVVANAEEEKVSGDWSYVVYDKIEGVCDKPCIEITKYNQSEQFQADIPAEIDGYPVVSLAGDTFKETVVDRINIPSSITHFGEGFTDNLNQGIVAVDGKFEFLPNFVNNYDDNNNLILEGFSLMTYISDKPEDVEIPETVCGLPVTEIQGWVFSDNKNIKSVKIPDTVCYFGTRVFTNSSVTSVNIPKSLRILPSATFKDCSALKSVEFHENLIIGTKAFDNSSFQIPDNVKLPESAFYAENSYSPMEGYTDEYSFKISYNYSTKNYTAEIDYFIFHTNPDYLLNISDIVVPESIYNIPVTSVFFKFSSTLAGHEKTFDSITFPSGVTIIGRFCDASDKASIKFRKIIVNSDNSVIYEDTFKNTDIEEVTINGSCNIGKDAFMGCEKLKKVEFTGDNPTLTINRNAFKNCTALEEVIFPENITADLDIDSFRYCSALKELTLNGNINATSHAFRECDSLEKLTIKGDDVTLDKNAFCDCKNLTDIEIDTDKPINGSAFNGCTNLLNINSAPVFDTSANVFYPEINDFIFSNFNNADDVGFINLYVQEQVNNFVENYITDDMTDMQKIKTAHDWVCNNIVYDGDDNMSLAKNHNDASVFMNDSSVCEGYARCYNLLLNAAGIETYFLMSQNHAWNVVKLGGYYFHSDTTWDDGDTISHDWFLKSDEEMLAETASHASWKLNNPSSMHSFQKETLPECKYKMGDANTDGEINIADLVVMNKYLTGQFSVNASDLTNDGVIDVFDVVCMRQLINKYLTGQSSINADDIVLFDLTYDGVVDVFDLVCMRQLLLDK